MFREINYTMEIVSDNTHEKKTVARCKMHKNPCEMRFIITSGERSLKPISGRVTGAVKLIYQCLKNFHEKAKVIRVFKKFWIIDNSKPAIDSVQNINNK